MNSEGKALLRALRPVSRRIRLCRVARAAQAALVLALLAALGWVVASFLLPIEGLAKWASLSAAIALIVPPLLAALWPVGALRAARTADGLGLQERALTALTVEGDGPMHRMQREDALLHLARLDARGLRPDAQRRELIASSALALAVAVLLLIPSPQHAALSKMRAFEKDMKKLAEAAEQRQRPDEDAAQAQDPALRRLEKDLLDAIRKSRTEREALTALDAAEQRLEKLTKAMQPNAAEPGADSAEQSGQGESAEASGSGDSTPQSELAQALGAQAQGQMSSGASGKASGLSAEELAALLSQLRQGVSRASAQGQQAAQGMSGSGQGQGRPGDGQGQGDGEQNGSGAGGGTTNKDAGLGSEMKDKSGTGGNMPLQHRVGEYESIYDPERISGSDDPHMAQGELKEGDVARVQLGPGQGQLQGDVPYDRVIGDYAPQAAKAADDAAISPAARRWVRDYFDSLID